MKKLISRLQDFMSNRLLSEDISIQNKLCNLIIAFTFVGCFATFIVSLVITPGIFTAVVVLVALIIIGVSLYLSAYRQKPTIAALIIILLINEIVFPIMYYVCGGIHSGMGIWFVVGMIFPFLVLDGRMSLVVFAISFLTLGSCFMFEQVGYISPVALEGFSWTGDVVQSMLIVSLIFGGIFKIQNLIYTRQNNSLQQKEKELLETMKMLESANSAKSDFLANMSHEIRTPINAIMGINEIVLRDSNDEDTIQNSRRIQEASNNLLSLVNNILDFSKIESGKMEIICEDYALSSILNDCYNMINLRAYNKGLEFRFINNPKTPENLYGDQFHIFQVLSNLLTNAVKYTSSGKVELNVSFEKTDEDKINLILAVTDTGSGISEANLNDLFKSFQRIDEHKNRSIEGTGLGLAITHRLVEQMGGRIEVKSEVDVGSTFTAIIPQIVKDDVEIGEFSKRYEDAINSAGPEYTEKFIAPSARILSVDDVRINLVVFKGLLKNTKVQIDTALSGKEALELSDKEKYDLIFMDHMMPEMDGIETLAKLKERQNINHDTPVVVLTANAIKGAEEEYKNAGFDNYLSKPVHGVDLENMVLQYLPKSKLEREMVK